MIKIDLNSFAEELKANIDILEHISKYEKLKQVGDSWQGPHSAHSKEDSDSTCFSINTEESYFNCFSCGTGGDVIAYEALRTGSTQVEAMKSLAREYNIEIPDLSSYESLSQEEKDEIEEKGKQIKIIEEVFRDYEDRTTNLLTDDHIQYLNSRGLTEESIKKFKIGYTPESLPTLVRKYTDKDLIASGLFTESLKPVLFDRITIPFRRNGKPIHFLGRSLNPNIDAKYLSQRSARENVNEYAVSRSFWLHGNVTSKKADNKTYQGIVIVEGTLDALLAAQELGNDYIVISCNTTTISNEQAQTLSQMITGCSLRDIIICNDTEDNKAGHKGACRTIEKLSIKVREALIRADGRKNNSSSTSIRKLIEEKDYMPKFMPRFKMAILRKPPDTKKIDVADYISGGRVDELRKWLESAITVKYYNKYLIGDPSRFFGLEDGSRQNSYVDKRMVDELQWEGRYYLYQGELLYRYEDGVYVPDDNMLLAEIDKKLGGRSTSPLIERTSKLLCATTGYIPEGYKVEENLTMVNTKSGWLDFSKPVHGMKPEPHTPFRVSYAQISAEYDPDKSPEMIDKFLEDVLSGEDVVEFLKLTGYMVTRETKYQKAFLFSGAGGNGKSTAIKVLQHLLGQKNYAVRSLHSLEEDRFAAADIFGKLANFNTDLPARYIPDGENFKRISTGEEISAERKHKAAFQFIPECTLIFSANEIPRSSDTSYAYYRRWKFFAFDKRFTDSDAEDRNLLEKLTTRDELSGLLNEAWRFYNLLETQHGFEESERSKEIMTEYQADNDIVNAFALEFMIENPEGSVLKQELYNTFKDFVEERGSARDRISQIRFNRRLKALYGNRIIEATDYQQGNRKCWRGIEINSEAAQWLEVQRINTD